MEGCKRKTSISNAQYLLTRLLSHKKTVCQVFYKIIPYSFSGATRDIVETCLSFIILSPYTIPICFKIYIMTAPAIVVKIYLISDSQLLAGFCSSLETLCSRASN